MSGLTHGVRGLDHRCYNAARSSRLRGTFRGFVSAVVQDINTIVRRSERYDYPICNSKVNIIKTQQKHNLILGRASLQLLERAFLRRKQQGRALRQIYLFILRKGHSHRPKMVNLSRQFVDDNIIFRPNKSIWTGSTPDGRRNPSKYCDGWRSANSNNVGLSSDLR